MQALNSSMARPNPFRSFWMGGYECTDKVNSFGNRVDFLKITGHLDNIAEDYEHLSMFGIKTIREGIRWSQVERIPYEYDWTEVARMIAAARDNNIQIVWDICHFGFPDDLTPLHPKFSSRFASLCRAFAIFFHEQLPGQDFIVTPINEVSFLSWLGGEVGGTSPFCTGYGWETKYKLMRAYIEGIEALKAIDPSVRIMPTEPLVNMVAELGADDEQAAAVARMHEEQFQVFDILGGRLCPELGGQPEYVDILGCNFYFNNQWIIPGFTSLEWRNDAGDARWRPLHDLMHELSTRYNRPIVLSETSYPGEDKPSWMNFITDQCATALQNNIPLWGVCWYPIIDRPDWDHLTPWHKAGLWDVFPDEHGSLKRVLDHEAAQAFRCGQRQLEKFTQGITEAAL